jgi:3-hydroxyacyl-CoA dehydrogenase
MVLKTFNVQEAVYKKFSSFCKSHGISMSKQVQIFMESMVEEDPQVKKEYLEKLDRIRKGKFISVSSFSDRYGL